jgi:hypothetical protein
MMTGNPVGDDVDGYDARGNHAVALLAVLAGVHSTPHADRVVRSWFAAPLEHPNRIALTISAWRDLLNPAAVSLRDAQARVFEIISSNLVPLGTAWAAASSPPAGQTLTDTIRANASRAVKIAEALGQQIYFASGAFDDKSTRASTQRGEPERFCVLALPVLESLASVCHPAVTHHIVETIDHVSATQPRDALLIAQKAVFGDTAYAREPLGLDAALKLAKRYLADQRDLLQADPTCLTAERSILEAFVGVGWDQAMDLVEELDELFR